MNDRQAVLAIRDVLRAELEDPLYQYSHNTRSWIHTDIPLNTASYPRVRVYKRGPTDTRIISMGEEFLEQRILTIDIQFWTDSEFKWKNDEAIYLQDDELVEEYNDKIWIAIKASQSDLKTDYGLTGLKLEGDSEPEYEEETQKWTGIITIRLWYFKR